MALISERYATDIAGTLSCLDRVILNGTLVDIGYGGATVATLRRQGYRIFDYARFAEPLRDEIRNHAQRLAADHGLEIDHISKKNFRKDERIKEILQQRGSHPGLVHIFSAMEPCRSYRPWHDKVTHETFLRPRQAQCLHYYFYFVDEDLGLCHLRVPTWAPFRLQFYCNGHYWLARQLTKKGIAHTLVENAFTEIEDFRRAQRIANRFSVKKLHRKLKHYTRQFCPVVRKFPSGVHWSMTQIEYATDIVFRHRKALGPLYEALVRTVIHAVKARNVATFLGRRLDSRFAGQVGNDFHTRIEGTCIRHHYGPTAIKMYDKFGRVLRIETTVHDVTFFKHHRWVEHRDGTRSMQWASVRKTMYSLGALAELLKASNRRYLEFLSTLDLPGIGIRAVEKVARPARDRGRRYSGFNLFHGDDLDLFLTIARGEFAISGLRNRDLQSALGKTGSQISRLLKRLRLHGLIKKVRRTYKYYLTRLGQRVVACTLRLRETVALPALADATCP